jgi:diketogulonate reductase-like aldo/keto reductase
MATHAPKLTLNDRNQMPQVGLGVWQSKNGDEIKAVEWALQEGYRHIDTAAIYKNEEGVGQGIKNAGLPREEVFITTKLWNDDIRGRNARKALETSLEKLQLDYVDLYLLHWHVDGGLEAWKELEKFQQEGLVKSIGVSNYMPEHLENLIAKSDVVPAVDQIEFHPYNQQQDVLKACKKHNIAVTAWSPLMQGNFKEEPVLAEIAEKHGKTAAQVLLRWDLQRGVITIPKSVNQGRIQQNFGLFDFELSDSEMETIDGLAKEEGRFGPNPRDFDF